MCRWLMLMLFVVALDEGLRAEDAPGLEGARGHLQKGRYEEAAEAFEKLISSKPKDSGAALGLSRLHEMRGSWESAAELLTETRKSFPKDAGLRARMGELELLRGRYAVAAAHATAALKLDGDEPVAHWVRAEVFRNTGKLKEADQEYRWFVRYYNRVQPKDAETLLLVARGAAQYARWNKVSQMFGFIINTLCPDALADDKQSWETWLLSGDLLLEKYNRAEALPEFQSALAINPHAPDVHVSLARAALQKGDHRLATKLAGRALETNAQHVGALRVLASERLDLGDPGAAIALLDRARKVDPHHQETLALLAACYLLQDGMPGAEELDSLLANLDAVDQVEIAKPGRFARLVIELAERNAKPGYFLTTLADQLAARRKFGAAERLYKQAIAVMPQLSEPRTALGMLYMQTSRIAEARRILDEAFKADPFHVRVSNMRKVLRVLEGYETISTDHFVIRFDAEADGLLAHYMAEYLEEQHAALVEEFGFSPPHRTQFEIFHNNKGLSAHEWFSARMVGLPWIQTIGASTGMMVALASPTAAEEPFNWARVVKHEYVHVITLQQTKFNIPHWFTEALAVTSEGYPRPAEWNELLAARVPARDIQILDELNRGFTQPETPLDWQYAYCQSRLHARFLNERFGRASIQSMLEAYRAGLSTERALARATKLNQAQFEDQYRSFLDELVEGLRTGKEPQTKSLEDLEQAYVVDEDDAAAAGQYALALLQERDRRKAREVAERALAVDEKQPLGAVVMAELALLSQEPKQAAGFLVAALDRDLPHPEVLIRLARIRMQQGESAEAAKLFELGRGEFPDDRQWVEGLAAAYLKIGDDRKLEPVLEELVLLDADNFPARVKLAALALESKSYERAVGFARQALYIDVMDADVHRLLGGAHLGLKQTSAAVLEYERAVRLDASEASTRLGLARAYLADGAREKARKVLETLVKDKPEHRAARELLDSLK